MADEDEFLRQYGDVGSITSEKQPSWSSPLAPLGSGYRQRSPIEEQARRSEDYWRRPSLIEMLATFVGPKAPLRPTAGTTAASPRQVAMERGQQAFNAEGPAWLESGQRLSPMAREYSGAFAHRADMALRQAGGDFEKAMALLKDDKQARNVLTYWQQSGNNFRGYADPARSQAYWRGVDEFKMGDTPSRLNSAAIGGGGIAALLSQLYGDEPTSP